MIVPRLDRLASTPVIEAAEVRGGGQPALVFRGRGGRRGAQRRRGDAELAPVFPDHVVQPLLLEPTRESVIPERQDAHHEGGHDQEAAEDGADDHVVAALLVD